MRIYACAISIHNNCEIYEGFGPVLVWSQNTINAKVKKLSYPREKIDDRQANTIPLPFVCKLRCTRGFSQNYGKKITREHNFTLVKKQSRLDVRKFSFSQRAINVWNKLSTECVDASIHVFKNIIDKYLAKAGYT